MHPFNWIKSYGDTVVCIPNKGKIYSRLASLNILHLNALLEYAPTIFPAPKLVFVQSTDKLEIPLGSTARVSYYK